MDVRVDVADVVRETVTVVVCEDVWEVLPDVVIVVVCELETVLDRELVIVVVSEAVFVPNFCNKDQNKS